MFIGHFSKDPNNKEFIGLELLDDFDNFCALAVLGFKVQMAVAMTVGLGTASRLIRPAKITHLAIPMIRAWEAPVGLF